MTIQGILRQFIKTRYSPWRLNSVKPSHRGGGGGGGGSISFLDQWGVVGGGGHFIKQMNGRCCLVTQFQEIVCYSALGIVIHDIVNCSV